ncbi:hypothetical protein [Volucribacter amazonae]|uniref:Uncharacterized protein n=1 Tax=Volucribacter amazonae TaxID=256731 RepID=A0A9X4SMK1_9PAST|nr:hypothetical protein [Volucribacter amazonae]MDG6896233.1 hypothetical protein [Volucribacter amazonae]
MKKYFIILFALISIQSLANVVNSVEQARNLVNQSIKKYNLMYMPEGCYFTIDTETVETYEFDFYEIHDDKCGGDPMIAHRMFSYLVDKKTGQLYTSARLPHLTDWDMSYNPID